MTYAISALSGELCGLVNENRTELHDADSSIRPHGLKKTGNREHGSGSREYKDQTEWPKEQESERKSERVKR
jgi:hypothetical protein